MNLSRLKKHTIDEDTFTSEEKAEILAIKKENIWIPLEDVKAHFRVLDKLAEHDKV